MSMFARFCEDDALVGRTLFINYLVPAGRALCCIVPTLLAWRRSDDRRRPVLVWGLAAWLVVTAIAVGLPLLLKELST